MKLIHPITENMIMKGNLCRVHSVDKLTRFAIQVPSELTTNDFFKMIK